MVSMPIVMKIVSGCCRTIDTPLQRSDLQQHVVLVLPATSVFLQAFGPASHDESGFVPRVKTTVPFPSIFVF
jgi:hypothetical protein